MLSYRKLVLHVVVLSGIASSLTRQQPDPCQQRRVVVSVRDGDGQPLRGLSPANFRGSMHGRPLRITSVETGPPARRIVVLLDSSGSMTFPSEKWRLARLLAGDVVVHAAAPTQLALVSFSGEVREVEDFSVSRSALLDKVRKIDDPKQLGGLTGIADAIAKALDLLSPAQLGDSIYLITDGADNHSKHKLRQVRDALTTSGTRLFAFLLLDPMAGGNGPDAQDFRTLANESGGAVAKFGVRYPVIGTPQWDIHPRTRAAISLGAEVLYRQMENTYRLELELPSVLSKVQKWKLDIVDTQGRKQKEVDVIYPHELFPCTVQAAQY